MHSDLTTSSEHAGRSHSVREGAGRAGRELAALLGVLLVVAVIGAAFASPWLPREPLGGAIISRYAPVRNGEGRLAVKLAPDGTRTAWESQSTRIVPGMRLYTDVRQSPSRAIFNAIGGDTSDTSRLANYEVIEIRILELSTDGETEMTSVYAFRDATGEHLVGFTDPVKDFDVIFDPLPLVLPPSVAVGDHWETTGTFGVLPYRWTSEVLEQGAYSGPLGQFDDCLLIETTFATTRTDSTFVTRTQDRLCAGIGLVESQSLDPATGTLQSRTVAMSIDGTLASADAAPPPPALNTDAPPPADLSTWKMARIGRARASDESSESSIPPLWLPTDPPVMLAAGNGGDLVAFDVSTSGSVIRWTFHPDGTVYGAPAFDPASGRIYFGASDKRLYALDARGLFLWSFRTDDNVASRPLVVGDLVVFGSEDGRVYGLDAATGEQRWTAQTGGSVVSAPARIGDTVVIGSDDQTVYGLDASTGEQRWSYAAGGAVEAPIVIDDNGTAYVASRDGSLAAIPAATCDVRCDAFWNEKPGGALRTAPLILGDRVLAVDESGTLVAVSKEDGKRLWTDSERGYAGAPILVNDTVIVAGRKGDLFRLSPAGERQGNWTAADAVSATDPAAEFQIGPTVGGGNLWLADASGVLRRLGPPVVGEIPDLHLAWYDTGTTPPFVGGPLRWTPTSYNGEALVLDFRKRVHAVNPLTGAGTLLATLPGEGTLIQVDPVVDGDTLLTVQDQTLQAFDLKARRPLWQAAGSGPTYRPPVVAGDVALWATTGDKESALLALDLATGAERWRATLSPAGRRTGPVTANGLAFVGSPPSAYDLATGVKRWQATLDGEPLGGPALAPDGSVLYVGMLRADGAGGSVAALDAATGAVRWSTDLGNTIVGPIETLWLEDGVVVAPGFGGDVVALDAATGSERWRFHSPVARLGNVSVARGKVWFLLETARFYALDLQNGRPAARFAELELNLNTQGLAQRPLVVGDRVLMPIGLALLGFDVPGEKP